MKHETIPFLPPVFDGDVIFELPPCGPSSSASGAKNLEGMDKRYDGHPWYKLVTTLLGSITNPMLDAKLNSRDQTSSAPARLQKGRLQLLLIAIKKKSTGASKRCSLISGSVQMTLSDA